MSMFVFGALAGLALQPAVAGAVPQEPARPVEFAKPAELASGAQSRPGSVVAAAYEGAFATPVRLRGGEGFVKVEAPGYACPTLHDVDGDGTKDLVVGQFNEGKFRMYKGLGRGTYAAGEWLKADGKVAQVPGVW
jgi:hypothetical protein